MGILDKLKGKDKAHTHGHATMTAEAKMHLDPVCKMQVDEAKAAARSEYKGQTYYFCAAGCKKSFDADPEKFLSGGQAGGKDCNCGCSK